MEEIPAQEPVVPPAEDAPAPEVEEAKSAFEAPPPAVEAEEAPTAAQLLSGAIGTRQDAPPPPTAKPTQAKEAVIPARPEAIPSSEATVVEPVVKVAPKERDEWKFVKNVHFGEKVFLKDKTELKYRTPLFTIRDPKLAAQILEVADIYNIVLQ